MPLYNHAAYVAEAVGSALAQGDVLREVVVVDDGSTDDSPRIMADLAARDSRIRFRAQPNAGAHAAINAAIADCTGEFVAVLNSDDAYLPGRLDALALLLDDTPDAALAASRITFMDGAGAAIANPWYDDALTFSRAGGTMATALVNANLLMTTSNYLLRRDALTAVGTFAALRYAHDLDLALRILALGQGIALSNEPLLRYRMHGHNTINEDHRRVRAEWAICAAAYLTLRWDRPGAPEPDWDEAAAIAAVLARHDLARAVAPVAAYLRRHGGGRLDASPLLADDAFLARVRDWV